MANGATKIEDLRISQQGLCSILVRIPRIPHDGRNRNRRLAMQAYYASKLAALGFSGHLRPLGEKWLYGLGSGTSIVYQAEVAGPVLTPGLSSSGVEISGPASDYRSYMQLNKRHSYT